MAVIVVAGCGDAGDRDGAGDSLIDSGEPALAPPATRLMGPLPEPSDVDFLPVSEMDSAVITEPCPTDTRVDMNEVDLSVVQDEQFRLEPMLGVVLQYGSEHPDVFGGYGLHWSGAGDASVFVSFTADVAQHRAALGERVEYPDELIVCQAAASEADRNAIQATLVDELSGRFTSIGAGGKSGAVTVGLDASAEALAAELIERYGSAVDVTVGALTFPLDDATAVCGPTLEASLIDGLDVSVVNAATPVEMTPASTAAITVRLANTGDEPIRFDSGQPTTAITDVRGEPRTSDTRGVADVGIAIALDPGEHQDFDVEVALSSCDPALGYVIGPGDHFVVVSSYNARLQTDMSSEPLPITVVE